MNVLIAVSAILTLIALLLSGRNDAHLRRGRLLRASGSAAAFAATGAVGTAGILLFMSYLGYEQAD